MIRRDQIQQDQNHQHDEDQDGEGLRGEVHDGKVLGAGVHCGKVLGGKVLGGKVLGGKVLGGRVLDGKVLGGKDLDGKVLGGMVLDDKVQEEDEGLDGIHVHIHNYDHSLHGGKLVHGGRVLVHDKELGDGKGQAHDGKAHGDKAHDGKARDDRAHGVVVEVDGKERVHGGMDLVHDGLVQDDAVEGGHQQVLVVQCHGSLVREPPKKILNWLMIRRD